MAVRVKIEIETKNAKITVVAVANAGFETKTPEIVIPIDVAAQLGVWPDLPKETKISKYDTPVGEFSLYKIENYAKITLSYGNKDISSLASIVISKEEYEVLLSDKLISELKIVIDDAGKGLWHIKNESFIRESEPPQYW